MENPNWGALAVLGQRKSHSYDLPMVWKYGTAWPRSTLRGLVFQKLVQIISLKIRTQNKDNRKRCW